MTRMAMTLSDPNLPDNPLIFCNPAFIEQTGYAEAEALGRNCRFLQGPGTDRVAVEKIRNAIKNQSAVSVDIYNYHRDGRGFWNSLYISPVFDTDGRLVHYFASQLDVTELKTANLRQGQHLDAVGALASGVAHTFNNLITTVLSSIDKASRQASNDSQRIQLARAEQAARSAGRLTQQMLSFAQRQFLLEQSTDLNTLIRARDELMQQMVPENVTVVFNVAKQPLPVRLDTSQLELALFALMHNAAEAMTSGGQIVIGTRTYTSWDPADGHTGREWVEVSITDHGHGMTPDVARHAAEPFFSTKPSGTGLGLSMVQGFAEQSNGKLAIETEPGQGTTVRLAFPKYLPGAG